MEKMKKNIMFLCSLIALFVASCTDNSDNSEPNDNPNTDEVGVEVGESSVGSWSSDGQFDGQTSLALNYALLPSCNQIDVLKDSHIELEFEGSAPVVGSLGSIRVYRASDDSVVDQIDIGDTQTVLTSGVALNTKMNILGIGAETRRRVVNYQPVRIDGNRVVIQLHFDKLEYETEYYILIDSRVVDHPDFFGINDSSIWRFTTCSEPAIPTDDAHTVTVGDDEDDADFRTIQAAISFLAEKIDKDTQKSIYVRNGVYHELMLIRNINNLTIYGESREGVVIRYENCEGLNSGVGGTYEIDPSSPIGTTITSSGGRSVILVEGVDKLKFENMTFENTHIKSGSGDQAEVIYANNDNKAISFINCSLYSCQDTLNLKGFCWFYQSLIAGDVDFIWGSASAALFEECEIRSVADGYILQARVAEDNKGFVFLNCDITASDDATKVYLSRTAGSSSYFDNVTFASCRIAEQYLTYGWGLSSGSSGTLPNPSTANATNGYKLYNCTDLNGNKDIVVANSEYSYTLLTYEFEQLYSSREIVLGAYTGGVDWFSL